MPEVCTLFVIWLLACAVVDRLIVSATARTVFLEHLQVHSFWALAPAIRFSLERNALPAVQGSKSGPLNRRNMDENIGFAIVRGNKSEAFVRLEEFHNAGLAWPTFDRRIIPPWRTISPFTVSAAVSAPAATAAVTTVTTTAAAIATTATTAVSAAITAATAAAVTTAVSAAIAAIATTAAAIAAVTTAAVSAPAAAAIAAVTTTAAAVTTAISAAVATVTATAATITTTATTAAKVIIASTPVTAITAAAIITTEVASAKVTAEVLRTAKLALAAAPTTRPPVRIPIVHYVITLISVPFRH